MLKYVHLTCVFTLSAFALSAQAHTTAMVGIADAQTAQLNLLNPGVLAPAVGLVCTAAVSFVDASGMVLKAGTLTVAPGKSMSFSLRSDTDLNFVAGDRREIRATITIPSVAIPTAAASAPSCKLIPTLEMLDTVSGRTLVVLGHVEAVPSVVTAAP